MLKTPKRLALLLLILLCNSCQAGNFSAVLQTCENVFTLTNDFNGWFVEEGDYLSFLASASLTLYHSKKTSGYNCRYFVEYKSGQKIDEFGTYFIGGAMRGGETIEVALANDMTVCFEFSLYNSPTIDYVLIQTLDYDHKIYHLIYTAKYIFTAKG